MTSRARERGVPRRPRGRQRSSARSARSSTRPAAGRPVRPTPGVRVARGDRLPRADGDRRHARCRRRWPSTATGSRSRIRPAPGGKGTELAARLRDQRSSGSRRSGAADAAATRRPTCGPRCARPSSSSRWARCCAVDPAPHGKRTPTPAARSLEAWTKRGAQGRCAVKAVTWRGVNEIGVEDVPEPTILNDHDIILEVGLTATCGSDLHLLGGYIPAMRAGDVLGHEFMGTVAEVGPGVTKHQVGDRVVVVLVHQLRAVLVLQAGAVVAVRQRQPQPGDHRGAVGPGHRRLLRVLPRAGRLGGQPRPLHPGALRRPGRLRHPRRRLRRAGAVRLRRRAHRLDRGAPGGGAGPVTSSRCGAPAESGQMAARAAMLMGAERVVVIDRYDNRLEQVRHAHRGGDPRLRGGRRPRRTAGDDRRPRTGRLHRGGGHGGAQHRPAVPLRPGQAADAAADRTGRPRCGRRSTPAARAGRCSPSASSAASWTSSRSAR